MCSFCSRSRQRPFFYHSRIQRHSLRAYEDLNPEDKAVIDDITHREVMEEIALKVDVNWSDMPLEKLRRAGEIGWDIDPDGPTGPEKFDNVYNKVRLNKLS